MNPETIDKLKEVFAPVAEKIGQGAQFGWEVVMKQQVVVAWMDVFGAVVALIAMVAVGFTVKKAIAEAKVDRYSNWIIAGTLVGVFGGIISVIVFIVCTTGAIGHFLNPAYYALDFFIHLEK